MSTSWLHWPLVFGRGCLQLPLGSAVVCLPSLCSSARLKQESQFSSSFFSLLTCSSLRLALHSCCSCCGSRFLMCMIIGWLVVFWP